MRRLSILLATTLLFGSGAASGQQNEGAVIVRVLPNVSQASDLTRNWQSLSVARLPGAPGEKETTFAIPANEDVTSHSAIYVRMLPPGRYRIAQLSAMEFEAMGGVAWASVTIEREFGLFDVRKDQLTDLGVIVQVDVADNGKVRIAHDTAAEHPETPGIVKELAPQASALLANPILTWLPDTVPAWMPDAMRSIAWNSYGVTSPSALRNGALFYGSVNGVVYVAKHAETLHRLDVGVRSSIDAVLVTENGDIIAGGEIGVLRISPDSGRNWRSIRGNLPFGAITDLSEWRGKVIATTLRGDDVFVHAAAAGSEEWTQLARYRLQFHWFTGIPGVRPQSFVRDDKVITFLPSQRVAVYDLVSGQDADRRTPGGMQAMLVSADGVLRCICAPAIVINPYESRDLGQTWTRSSFGRAMRLPVFRDAKHGIAYRLKRRGAVTMLYTEDGGATWIESITLPAAPDRLFYGRDGETAYAAFASGEFLLSTDDGRRWYSVPIRQ